MNPDLGTELRSGRVISSSLETPAQTDPDMAQSSANDSDSNEVSDISSQLSEIKESYERKINELQNEFSQLKDLMMAVISKTDTENRQSTSKCPSKPAHTVGFDMGTQQRDSTKKMVGIEKGQNYLLTSKMQGITYFIRKSRAFIYFRGHRNGSILTQNLLPTYHRGRIPHFRQLANRSHICSLHCPSRDCLNFLHATWKHAG